MLQLCSWVGCNPAAHICPTAARLYLPSVLTASLRLLRAHTCAPTPTSPFSQTVTLPRQQHEGTTALTPSLNPKITSGLKWFGCTWSALMPGSSGRMGWIGRSRPTHSTPRFATNTCARWKSGSNRRDGVTQLQQLLRPKAETHPELQTSNTSSNGLLHT